MTSGVMVPRYARDTFTFGGHVADAFCLFALRHPVTQSPTRPRFPFSLIHKLFRLRRSGFALILICDRDASIVCV